MQVFPVVMRAGRVQVRHLVGMSWQVAQLGSHVMQVFVLVSCIEVEQLRQRMEDVAHVWQLALQPRHCPLKRYLPSWQAVQVVGEPRQDTQEMSQT